jgi:predicted transcriptional regulator
MTMTETAPEPAQRRLGVPGPLMLSIMGVLWRAGRPVKMAHIHARVCENHHPVSLTTISATLFRLKQRGWVSRPRDGMYQYEITRRDLTADVTDQLAKLIDETVLAIEGV